MAIAAKKEERDLGEAPINEELETVKATLAQVRSPSPVTCTTA